AGAYHYLTKPFELGDIAALLSKALEHKNLKEENRILKSQLRDRYRFENIIGSNEGLGEIFDMIEKVAETDSTVLILGESGTGKELVARALHYNSPRREKPLVTVNCAAIPEELLESELFGHVRGAFTGAVQTRPGRFASADGGTIFLDEIGDMSLKLQVKLLRVLQEQQFEPVGSNKSRQVDVRIIAATNHDLERAVRERRFREDLYYRLNVIPIHVPPLRERRSDIPLLVHFFLNQYNQAAGQQVKGIDDATMQLLLEYDWPGNVRELENTIERAVVMRRSGQIVVTDLPEHIQEKKLAAGAIAIPEKGMSLKRAVADFEADLIKSALVMTGGNKNRAASLLRLNRTTLVEKMKKHHGEKEW
ncbi:MAG: sigma-54-dependent Fis family transcriptional regulator, partial [Deltaproteobacteria bacterium]|nr:sigma-54-dependent Fis family transcriptional regulator [Deltaproteobacteria bacterium]